MRCGACGSPNAHYFSWAGVTSVRCPDCGADLLPGVDLMLDKVSAMESALVEAQRRAEAAERDMNRCCPCEVCNKSCKYDKTNAYDECADFEWRGPQEDKPDATKEASHENE